MATDISPTARLLRSSRLFSLPKPLPRPNFGAFTLSLKGSKTATGPSPTYQTITTPQTSLSRGDWGLKRPLPFRSTANTSTPFLNVTALDTFEHITDYESSSNYTLTLKKLQELNLFFFVAIERIRVTPQGTQHEFSVFEDGWDNTSKPPSEKKEDSFAESTLSKESNTGRWKFRGPWVGNMNGTEFERFLKSVDKRKAEFREYLKETLGRSLLSDVRTDFRNTGNSLDHQIPKEHYADRLSWFRRDSTLCSPLVNAVKDFFDMPPTKFDATAASNRLNPPPCTHGSAGLSYLRTQNFLENHPLFGPQVKKSPVPARVVSVLGTSSNSSKMSRKPVLGIAGVIVPDFSTLLEGIDKTKLFDIDTVGGCKIWVHVKYASVDRRGKIDLVFDKAMGEAIEIKEGKLPLQREILDLTRPALSMSSGSISSLNSRWYSLPRQSSEGYVQANAALKRQLSSVAVKSTNPID